MATTKNDLPLEDEGFEPPPNAPPVDEGGAEEPPEDPGAEAPASEGEGGEEGQEELRPHEKLMADLRAELEAEGEGEGEGGDEPGQAEESAADEADEGEGDEGEGDDELVLRLPGRQPDDDDIEVQLTPELLEAAGLDPEQARERLNQLHNGFGRRSALVAERRAFESERDEFYDALEADPSGFLVDQVREDIQVDVVKALLENLDDDAYNEVMGTADRLADPDARERARKDRELERRRAADEKAQEEGPADEEVEQIIDTMVGLVPEDWPDAEAEDFVRFAGLKLQRYAAEKKLDTLDPAQIPEILEGLGVLEKFGLSGDGESSNGDRAGSTSDASKKKGASDGGKSKGTGTRSRMERRRAASATTPAGAGGEAAEGFVPKKGETYLERRNRVARMLGEPEKEKI